MARYLGGPCDGRDVGANFNATLVCGGQTYTRGTDGNYRPAVAGAGAAGSDVLATHGHRGWADLQRAVNRSVPTTLSHAQTVRRAARRRLAKRGRLG